MMQVGGNGITEGGRVNFFVNEDVSQIWANACEVFAYHFFIFIFQILAHLSLHLVDLS